jgi:transcriptional regulator with XRE-family HTH domain
MYNRALKLIRQYHRLTQTELAAKLGISKSYVNDIERDRREPSLDVLRRYADAFDMPLSSLQLFAERAADTHFEKVRTFAADKVLKMLEWVADEPDETAKRGSSRAAHSAR